MTEQAKTELAKCPLSGCGGVCGFRTPRRATNAEMLDMRNSLCEDIRVGRLISDVLGTREIDGIPEINCASGSPGPEYLRVWLQGKAPKLNKDDVLRRWRAADFTTISDGKFLQLCKDTDVVLEAVP